MRQAHMNRMRLRRLPWRLRYEVLSRSAWRLRRWSIAATHLHADVRIASPVRLGPGFTLHIPEPATFRTGPGCDFRRGFVCEVGPGGVVDIGAGTVFTSYALIQISTTLTIGKRCALGQDLLIADGNHRFRDHTRHLLDQGYDLRPITIDDGAIVMSKCTVMASIGRGAIVGANSVVTRDVPPWCLAVGAPARVIEYFGPPEHRPAGLDIPTS
jgi:acetyltransferase-like isoleucine patch superfamily enzyme